jgi:hypothetical protein
MSNIRKSDVKNHLSPRFRTQIHVCQPESLPDTNGFSAQELPGAEPTLNESMNHSMEDALGLSSTNRRKPVAGIAPRIITD